MKCILRVRFIISNSLYSTVHLEYALFVNQGLLFHYRLLHLLFPSWSTIFVYFTNSSSIPRSTLDTNLKVQAKSKDLPPVWKVPIKYTIFPL